MKLSNIISRFLEVDKQHDKHITYFGNIIVCRLANLIVLASKLMPESKFPTTTSQARNMIKQGAVKVNGVKIVNPKAIMLYTHEHEEILLSIGKRKHCKLRIPWKQWEEEIRKENNGQK